MVYFLGISWYTMDNSSRRAGLLHLKMNIFAGVNLFLIRRFRARMRADGRLLCVVFFI